MDAPQRGLWTISQRRALAAILLILAAGLTIRWALNPTFLPDPQLSQSPKADDLIDRLDPNTADQAMLAAIPRLGEKRAAAIVEYRQLFLKSHPGKTVFFSLDDLGGIKGIGPATLEGMAPYLTFPARQSRTPASLPVTH